MGDPDLTAKVPLWQLQLWHCDGCGGEFSMNGEKPNFCPYCRGRRVTAAVGDQSCNPPGQAAEG